MKFTKILAAVAVSAAFIAPATAATMGMADLAITGLAILNNQGAPVTTGINITNESRTGTATASFNGVVASGAGNDILSSSIPGDTVDVGYRCGGPSCGAAHAAANYGGNYENNGTSHIMAPAGSYSLSDMYIAGSAIGFGGANGLTRANSSVAGPTNTGTSNATIANSVRAVTTFTAGTTMQARFALGYNAYIAAFVNAGAGVTGSALGTISWVLTLREVGTAGTLLAWAPEEINTGISSNGAGDNVVIAPTAGLLFSNLVTLTAGKAYTLTINQASNSLAEEIPEPGSMVLVALGLFALGAASRRNAGK